jgi:phytanoyl-CoA hydroxylase
MLPTRYHPPFQNNIFESITADIVKQLHPQIEMVKDYDQLLNKRPGKSDAVFAWHQDMGCE